MTDFNCTTARRAVLALALAATTACAAQVGEDDGLKGIAESTPYLITAASLVDREPAVGSEAMAFEIEAVLDDNYASSSSTEHIRAAICVSHAGPLQACHGIVLLYDEDNSAVRRTKYNVVLTEGYGDRIFVGWHGTGYGDSQVPSVLDDDKYRLHIVFNALSRNEVWSMDMVKGHLGPGDLERCAERECELPDGFNDYINEVTLDHTLGYYDPD